MREFAVRRLEKATEDDIVSFMLQLVQALRFEPHLIAVASAAADGAKKLAGPSEEEVLSSIGSEDGIEPMSAEGETKEGDYPHWKLSPLADFLINRACSRFVLNITDHQLFQTLIPLPLLCSVIIANYFFHFVNLEVGDPNSGFLYSHVISEYIEKVRASTTAVGKLVAVTVAAVAHFTLLPLLVC